MIRRSVDALRVDAESKAADTPDTNVTYITLDRFNIHS